MARFIQGTVTPTESYGLNNFESMTVGNITHVSGSIGVAGTVLNDAESLFNPR